MSELSPILDNMTNNELVKMSEQNGYAVNAAMVQVLCNRLEQSQGELNMFRTLNNKVLDCNARLQVELGMYLDELKTITEG